MAFPWLLSALVLLVYFDYFVLGVWSGRSEFTM